MIQVSAGIVYRDDGKILVCQRGSGRNHAHLWEFPGGKQEPGEDAIQCLKRELMEELSLSIYQVQEKCVHESEGICFTFLEAKTDSTPIPTQHESIRYCSPRELLELPFCPADTEIARTIAFAKMPCKYFLWDFDGTLADTYPIMVQFLSKACSSLGFDVPQEQLLSLMKESLPHAIKTLADSHGLTVDVLRTAYEKQNEAYDPTKVPPISGIINTVKNLQGKHFLVTHRDAMALQSLQVWGLLDCFAGHMLAGDEGFVRKPDPAGILRLMKDYHINPNEAIMIGDRPLDMQAGRSAGIATCLLDTENRFDDEPSDVRVQNAADILKVLQPEW